MGKKPWSKKPYGEETMVEPCRVSVTDGRTDRQNTMTKTAQRIASCGKNATFSAGTCLEGVDADPQTEIFGHQSE